MLFMDDPPPSLCSIEVKSSTRPYAGCLFNLNVLLLPLTLALVALSSLFSAPLLALFTLPLFAVAFPREGIQLCREIQFAKLETQIA